MHSSRVFSFWVKIGQKIWEVLKECWKELYKLTYECSSKGSDYLQKRFGGILFSSSLQVMSKGSVFNRNTALCTELTGNSCNSAFSYKAPPAVREWIYKAYIYRSLYLHSACAVSVWPKTDRICMPCSTFWLVDEKQAYVDSTHLNNSDKLSRIFMEQIKYIQSFINQLQFWLNPFLYLKTDMWGLPFYETFSKLY